MKGQMSTVELIFVLIILIVAFGVFFPGFVYKNRWDEAYLMLDSRDLILTMERMNVLYQYSFNKNALSLFLDTIVPTNRTNLVPWSEVDGTVQDRVIVACNCTKEQIDEMNFWYEGLRINGRGVKIFFVQSLLESIPQEADVLLIRDYKPMEAYMASFRDYLARGVGIVEVMNFTNQNQIDATQTGIFGLKWMGQNPTGRIDYIRFRKKPEDARNITYGPYKYFYHIPIPLLANSSTDSVSGCQPNPPKGRLTFNETIYNFYICQSDSARFDTDGDGTTDTLVQVNQNFKISGYNFTLNYVNGNTNIGLSFKPNYYFADFLRTRKDVPADPGGEAWGVYYKTQIYPSDDNPDRILLKADKNYEGGLEIPAVILNATQVSRVAWISDFSIRGVGDDEKELLLSILFWSLGRKPPSIYQRIKSGYSSSYINVNNQDMYEIYKFTLGLAYPY